MNRNVFSDLKSPGSLGKKPIIGLTMFVIGILIFTILVYNLIIQGPLIKLDLSVSEFFNNLAIKSSPFVIDIMIAGYYLGLQGIFVFAVLLSFYFLYKRFWREFFMVTITFAGGGILFEILSNMFKRPRPFLLFDQKIWSGSPNIPGFPSGHTLSIVVLCGFLIYLLVPRIKSYFGKSLVVFISLLIAFYIGFSRLYVGDHYLTDIIAGYAMGIAWFGLAVTSIELLFKLNEKSEV